MQCYGCTSAQDLATRNLWHNERTVLWAVHAHLGQEAFGLRVAGLRIEAT